MPVRNTAQGHKPAGRPDGGQFTTVAHTRPAIWCPDMGTIPELDVLLDSYTWLPSVVPDGTCLVDGTPVTGDFRQIFDEHFAPLAEWEAAHGPWKGIGLAGNLSLASDMREAVTGFEWDGGLILARFDPDCFKRSRDQLEDELRNDLSIVEWCDDEWGGGFIAWFTPSDVERLACDKALDELSRERDAMTGSDSEPWDILQPQSQDRVRVAREARDRLMLSQDATRKAREDLFWVENNLEKCGWAGTLPPLPAMARPATVDAIRAPHGLPLTMLRDVALESKAALAKWEAARQDTGVTVRSERHKYLRQRADHASAKYEWAVYDWGQSIKGIRAEIDHWDAEVGKALPVYTQARRAEHYPGNPSNVPPKPGI